MTQTFNEIIELAKLSGIPNNPGSTVREGDRTKSGSLSGHHYGQAVDFMGENQDALAEFFMSFPTVEVIHYSNATGKFYGWNGSRGRAIDPAKNQDLVKEHANHLHVWMAPEQLGPGSVLDNLRRGIRTAVNTAGTVIGGILSAPKNVTEALGNIGQAAANLATSTATIANLANRMFLPGKALRAAAFMMGTSCILIGIWFLAREVKESNP